MSPADLAYWKRAQSRVAGLMPDIQRALLRSYAIIRDSLSPSELETLIRSGQLDRLVAQELSDQALDRALLPFRQRLRLTTERAFDLVVRDLPRGGRIGADVAVGFNHLNPRVLDAIRELETGVIGSLKSDIREVVRDAVKRGLEAGSPPRTIARTIPDVIGLGPSQLQEVENYRDALRGVSGRSVTNYTLRNPIVDRLLAKGALTDAQVERYAETYRKARITANTQTITRTATLQSYKQGQALSWRDAIDAGVVDGDRLKKQWIQIDRPSKRASHIPLAGEIVPFNEPYSNGQMVPGEDPDDYNCGCLSRVFIGRAGE